MTDALYCLSLLVALVAGVVGSLAGLVTAGRPSPRVRRLAMWSGLLAIAAGLFSGAVHLRFGHGPEAPEPMALGRFLRIHPVYGVVLLLVLATIAVVLGSRRRD